MSISLYTATTVAAADAGGANSDAALTRLRQRLIVNRFNNEPVTDNASSINGVTGGAGTAVNINSATNVTTAGFYVFINRTITLGSSGTLRAAAAGVHFAFFNCRIETDSDQGTVTNAPISTNQNLHTGTPTSGSAAAGAAGTRSVNYYGCWYTQESSANSIFHFFTDFFNSTMESVVDRTFIPTTFTGARIVNGTFRGNANIGTSLLSPYRSPEILDGMILSAMSYEMPQVGLTQLIQVNPQLLNPFFPQKYRVNIPNGNGAIIHNIGYSSPASNVTDDTITTANAGDAYYFSPGGINTGGPINYYPWTMRCFSDVAQTQAVENVRFRLASSVPLNNGAFILNTVTANTIDTTINSLASGSSVNAQSFATVARNTVTDYLTDANGRPFLTGARYSRDGGSTFVNNTWFDWLRFNIRNTTTNVNALGTAFSNTDAPDNVIFAPVQMVAWDRYNYFAASLEGRSYTNDIHFEEDVRNGVINDANGPQPSEAISGTTQNLIGAARATIVATSEATADSNFGTNVSSKSWQTIYDKLVRDWSTYTTDQFFEITNNQIVVPHTVAISNSNSDISYGPSLLGLTRLSGIVAPAAGDVVTGISATTIQGDITNLPSGTSIAGAFTDTNSGAVRAYNFAGVDVSGLSFTANGTGDITIAGAAMDDFAAFNDTGTGNVTFIAAPFNYIFNTGNLAGRVAVRNLTTDTNITPPTTTVTAGTPFSLSIASSDSRINNGDTVRIYYKATNQPEAGYALNFTDVVIDTTGSTDVTVSVAALAIDDALYVRDSEAQYTGASIEVANITGGIQINISGATSTTRTGGQTQNLLLEAADDVDAFSVVVNEELTQDIVRATVESTSVDGSRVTLNSGETGVVQLIQAVSGGPTILGTVVDGTVRAGIPSVTIFENPLGLSADGATLACRTAIQSENLATAGLVGGLY